MGAPTLHTMMPPPADYTSTARALALPLDSPDSHSPSHHPPTNPYRLRSHSTTSGSASSSPLSPSTLKARLEHTTSHILHSLRTTYTRLTPLQRALALLAALLSLTLGILFLTYSHAIFSALGPLAQRWRALPGGWLILWFLTVLVGFPPLIGYSSCVTLAGFVYGFPRGWPIAASATVLGSAASFLLSRHLFLRTVRRLTAADARFAALGLVLKRDGLPLLFAIRLCPLPYSLSNGALATFPTVKLGGFMLATAAASPKLLVAVFVGSRMAKLAEGEEGMDARTKAVNWASIVGGMAVGIATGWVIWRRTSRRARQLEMEEGARLGGGEGEGEGEGRAEGRWYSDELGNQRDGASESGNGNGAGVGRHGIGLRRSELEEGYVDVSDDEDAVLGQGRGDEESGYRDADGAGK